MENGEHHGGTEIAPAKFVSRVLETDLDAGQEQLLLDLEARQWALAQELRSKLDAGDSEADPRVRQVTGLLSDVMLATAALVEADAYSSGGVWWNLGGFLSDAKMNVEAANAFLRAGFKLREVLATAVPGSDVDEADDIEQWAESAFFHACRYFVAGNYLTAAAAVVRLMHSQDLLTQAQSLLNDRIAGGQQ